MWKVDVILSPQEIEIGTFIGNSRQSHHERLGTPSERRDDTTTDLNIHVIGVLAEIALAKVANLYPHLDTRSIRDHDLLSRSGRTIDVKNTKYLSGRLQLPIKFKDGIEVPHKCEIYALVVGEPPHFSYRGYLTKENIVRKEYIGNLGMGDAYLRHQEFLVHEVPE